MTEHNHKEKLEARMLRYIEGLWKVIEKYRLKHPIPVIPYIIRVNERKLQHFKPKGFFIVFFDEEQNVSELLGLRLPEFTLHKMVEDAYLEREK